MRPFAGPATPLNRPESCKGEQASCEGNAPRDEPNRRRSPASGLAGWVWAWVRAGGNRERVVYQLVTQTIVRTPSSAALKVLATVGSGEHGGDFLFPGGRPGRPLSNGAMLELVKEMDWADEKGNRITPHGFRSTLRTWAAECTDFPDNLVKASLGQTVGTKVDAAYQRGDMFEKRKRLMADWADFCARAPAGGKVLSMANARR